MSFRYKSHIFYHKNPDPQTNQRSNPKSEIKHEHILKKKIIFPGIGLEENGKAFFPMNENIYPCNLLCLGGGRRTLSTLQQLVHHQVRQKTTEKKYYTIPRIAGTVAHNGFFVQTT